MNKNMAVLGLKQSKRKYIMVFTSILCIATLLYIYSKSLHRVYIPDHMSGGLRSYSFNDVNFSTSVNLQGSKFINHENMNNNTSSFTDASKHHGYLKERNNEELYNIDKSIQLTVRGPNIPDFIISNQWICRSVPYLKYIFYTFSAPQYFDKRTFLRSTWANRSLLGEHNALVVFITGLSTGNESVQEAIRQESDTYMDIVQGDFIDTYDNLTLKSILALKWIKQYCQGVKFVIKLDDDVFLDIFKFVPLIKTYEDKSKTLLCDVLENFEILRDPPRCYKWCVNSGEFPGLTVYPKFCYGSIYSYSSDLIDLLYSAIPTTPFFRLEDVYVTGLLTRHTPQIMYVSIVDQLTFDGNTMLEQYSSPLSPVNYIIGIVDNTTLYSIIWKNMLKKS